jgi:Phage integrase, N-terminal SAM-like domain
MSELFEAWFALAEIGWAPTTTRQTRSVLDRYLHPHLGHRAVGDVTPSEIDAFYAKLRSCGGVGGEPLMPGTLARIHVALRASLSQAMLWGWIGDNNAERAHRIVTAPTEHDRSSGRTTEADRAGQVQGEAEPQFDAPRQSLAAQFDTVERGGRRR